MEGLRARLNLRVLQEPRGFMKFLEFVISMCAFLTLMKSSTYFTFSISCSGFDEKPNVTITEKIAYPFRINKIHTSYSACGAPEKYLQMPGDFSSDAQFFCAVGILALMYVLVAVVLYCYFSDLYENKESVPIMDFGVHVVFAIMWLAASSAWVNSYRGLRSVCTLDTILKFSEVCTDDNKYECNKLREPVFGTFTIPFIFGYLNFFLWTSNLWFLYKETTFYKYRKTGEEPNAAQ